MKWYERNWDVPGEASPDVGGMSRSKSYLICTLIVLLASGCGLKEWADNGFKVGPNYKPPPAPIAAQWIDYQRPDEQAPTQPAELKQCWRVFGDPVLNSLISDAYQQNLSLRVAGERIAEARAVRGIAVGNLFPQSQEVAGSYAFAKGSNQTANHASDQY